MANYYVPLAQQTPGQGINLEPINAALDSIQQQNSQNRAYAFQQKQFDATQQQRQFENARATKQDENAEIKMFGDRAKAFSQLAPDDPVRQNWGKLVQARHPNAANLDPRYLDPIEGPKLVMAEAGEYLDPRDSQAKDLALQETRAKINKLNVEAQNGGEAYGKTGTVVQGSDGKYYSVQFGSHGQRQILPLELGGGAPGTGGTPTPAVSLTPDRGVEIVGDTAINKTTAAPVRNVGANIAEGERQKVVGRETGEGQMNLPKSEIALETSKIQNATVINSIDQVLDKIAPLDKPGGERKPKGSFLTGYTGSIANSIPGTEAHDIWNTLNTIKANLGFDKLQAMRDASPTGGALGQVSEMENKLLQSVWGSIEQSQSAAQLVANLQQIRDIRQKSQELRQRAYDMDVQRFGKTRVPDWNIDQPTAKAGGTPVHVNTPEDAMKLPSGTTFVTPDGRIKVRP
jgi:hypothetical protein